MSQTGKERSALWDYMVRSGLMNVREHLHTQVHRGKQACSFVYIRVCVCVCVSICVRQLSGLNKVSCIIPSFDLPSTAEGSKRRSSQSRGDALEMNTLVKPADV